MSNQNYQINRFHQDKWKVFFSNIPTETNKKVDMSIFDSFAKSVIMPDFSVETVPTLSQKGATINPVSQYNFNQSVLTLEFKISENVENYFLLWDFLNIIRYHKKTPGFKTLKDTVIKSIDLQFLNNEKNNMGKFRFTNAIITNLGSLSLDMGVAEEVTFAVSFEFEECKLVRQ